MACQLQEEITPSAPEERVETASSAPQEHRSLEPPSSTAATPREKRKKVLVIAGQLGSGKSTALNNLFGTNFKAGLSAYSETTSLGLRRTQGTENDLIIVDTPGFGASDLRTKEVKKELENFIGHLDCVLIYCYSTRPGSRQNILDELAVKNLEKVLGMKVWQKCVVLFTFSDQLRDHSFKDVESREEYKDLIRSHAEKFHEILIKKCGDHVPNVKTIFDIDLDAEDIKDIVAVPVGLLQHKEKEKYELVPDIDTTWLDTALFEIIRKANKENQEVYLDHLLHRKRLITSAAVMGLGVGAAIGAAGGVVAGAATLGFGVIAIPVGAAVGAAIGGAAATTGGLSIRKMRDIIIASRKKERLNILEEKAEIIQPKPADQCQQQKKVARPTTSPKRVSSPPIPINRRQEIKLDTATHDSLPTPVVQKELPKSETPVSEPIMVMDNDSSETSQESIARNSEAENPYTNI